MIKHSSEQLDIINWFQIGKGNSIVRARAGSGKTYTIVQGLNKANASSALYAVFNKRNQVEAVTKITNPKVSVKTLHSVGYGFVLNNWRGVRASGFAEYGRCKQLAPDAPPMVLFQCAKLISFLKNTFITMPTLKEAIDTANVRDIDAAKHADLWTVTRLAELAINAMKLATEYPKDKFISFEDMLWLPVFMGWVKPSYMLCTIDEGQDMNFVQLTMAILCCLPNGRICIVADDKQCIYNFRGAMQNGVDTFKSKLNAKEFPLTTSYRCPKKIIALAQTIVPDIKAHENAIEGEIHNINHDKMLNDIKVNHVILSRTNAPLTKSCLALLRKGKPAYITGKDIGKMLVDLINSFEVSDINSLYNKLDLWLAVKQAKATLWNADSVAYAIDTAETIRVLAESCLTVSDIKNKIEKLFVDADSVRVPSVILSSLHKFKGLEADFINLLSWTFNNKRGGMTPSQVIEEQNILYTAYTRSKNTLIHVSE